jgi:hypothetical protein
MFDTLKKITGRRFAALGAAIVVALSLGAILSGPAAVAASHPTIKASNVAAGNTVRITGAGFAPGSRVPITIGAVGGQDVAYSATATANAKGDLSVSIRTDRGVTPGTWQVAGYYKGAFVKSTFTVTAPAGSGRPIGAVKTGA